MFHMLHRHDQQTGAIAQVEFEGGPYGAGISFFVGELAPGKGPGLHRHPYAETCIIHSGRALMTVGGEETVAGPGDIVVIEPAVPHRFTAIGDEKLFAVAVHASDRFIIEWLGEEPASEGPDTARVVR